MRYIGAHVSAAGGPQHAPQNAQAIGATGFAMFTKSQRQWAAPPLKEADISAFKQTCATLGYPPAALLPHASYLINMGNAEPAKWQQSVNALTDELQRAATLGLNMVNFHPGAHLNLVSEKECLSLIANGINQVLAHTEGVIAVVENTAGQGSNLGYRFEQIAEILAQVEDKERVGVCVDTCHAFAGGYDLSTPKGYEAMWQEFDSTVGLSYLRGLHLNDAMKPLGSRVDRHSPLGEGCIGLGAFELLAKDPRFEGLPLILETPEPERWPMEIARLREWAGE